MTQDRIQTIGRSRIQHGPLSDRVYLMHLGDGDAGVVIDAMQSLARAEGYTKLFAKIPAKSAAAFTDAGFETEARIPDFYDDGDTALFMSRFRSENRRRPGEAEKIRNVLEAALRRADAGIRRPLPEDCELTRMTASYVRPTSFGSIGRYGTSQAKSPTETAAAAASSSRASKPFLIASWWLPEKAV